jgi:hypothetical protein
MTLATSRAKLFSRAHMILPLAVLVTAGILTSDVTSSEAANNRAAASCTLNVPSRVAISSPYMQPTFSLGADCAAAGVIYARWEAKRADGVVMKKAYFNFSYPTAWSVFDTTSLAPWTWQPAGATTAGDVTAAKVDGKTPVAPSESEGANQVAAAVPQNTPATDIRMESRIAGYFVPADPDPYHRAWLFAIDNATRYAITPHNFILYGGARGSLQQRAQGAAGWAVIANLTTDSSGKWAINLPGPTVRTEYRFVLYDAQYIFGAIGNLGWITPS